MKTRITLKITNLEKEVELLQKRIDKLSFNLTQTNLIGITVLEFHIIQLKHLIDISKILNENFSNEKTTE